MNIPSIVIAMVLPPLAVAFEYKLGMNFWINLLLTFLGVVPGIYHAFYVLVNK